MPVRLGRFEMPKRLTKEEATATETYAKFVAEPFETGYGHTVGNSLRRVLLSSLEGPAITSIKVDGAMHEFATIEGVVEDVTDIVLNLKKILLKAHTRDPQTLLLSVNKDGDVTAADIQLNQNVELVNSNQHICTLDKKKKFEMELEVKVGRGFLPGDENKKPNQAIGVVAIDSLFSPVTRVRYAVENARVGQRTDYDRLLLEIWTDGRISPDDALTQASAILQHHLDVFVGYDKNAVEFEEVVDKQDEEKTKLKKLLNMSVNEIELSVRAANCLNNANITTALAKAKAARSVAEKMVTLGKRGTIHDRRLAAARLHQEDIVKILFNEIAPRQKERRGGGYTRIVRLDQRQGDAAQRAILEWVDLPVVSEAPAQEASSQETEPEGKTTSG